MTIRCIYHSECDILNKNPSWSREYKSRVSHLCGTDAYTSCPMYTRIDAQKKAISGAGKSLGGLENI